MKLENKKVKYILTIQVASAKNSGEIVTKVENKDDYFGLISETLRRKIGGFNDLSEMKTRMDILDKIKKANSSVTLEKAEMEMVQFCINPSNFPWSSLSKDIIEMIETINKISE